MAFNGYSNSLCGKTQCVHPIDTIRQPNIAGIKDALDRHRLQNAGQMPIVAVQLSTQQRLLPDLSLWITTRVLSPGETSVQAQMKGGVVCSLLFQFPRQNTGTPLLATFALITLRPPSPP